MKKIILFLFAIGFYQLNAQVSEEKLDSIINELSLAEKVYLLVGTGMDMPGVPQGAETNIATVGTTKDKVPGAAGTSYTNEKFNFPAVVFADGPAGIRISPKRDEAPEETFYATAFPTATGLASSWDIDLVKKVGAAFGREGKEYGVDFLLAPALNIQRNPLGGRNFEYYSEDPVLAGNIAAAFVNGVQSEGIGATIKHFVANNSETNRMALNTIVSERALREIYLKGFKIAIEKSHPWAVMSSYNKINGTYASENKNLLTDILRNDWGYDGFVMTDWFAGKDAVAQVKAGNDLLMPGTAQQATAILEAAKNGDLKESTIDGNVKRILKKYYLTPSFNDYKVSNKPDLELNKEIAREAAAEGMILLKNDNALPLDQSSKVALFGVTSVETISGGTGSGDVNKAYMVSVKDGFENAGFQLDNKLATTYASYVKEERAKVPPKKIFFLPDVIVPEKKWTEAELADFAKNNDVGIYTLGRTSGEFQDRKVENDFDLNPEELELIKDLSEAFHAQNKKFIMVLNIGGVIETESWKQYPDAILLAWQPGQEAGNAIADVLKGKVNPSGKLAVTFPKKLNDEASSKNFPGKALDPDQKPENIMAGVPSEEKYEEGIYVGYRYFDTFGVEPSFPFGYGISYTQFDYSDLEVSKNQDQIKIEFKVTNTGKVAGEEVAQIYVHAPNGAVQKPEKELKAFSKTKLLEPNESQQVQITLNTNDLGYFDEDSNSWQLEGGDYEIIVGSDSQTPELKAEVSLEKRTISTTSDALNPQIEIKELSKK